MAVTVSRYNHTRKLEKNQELSIANFKFMLRSSTPFDGTHTTTASLAGSEVSGNGWTAGGETATYAVTTVDTDDARGDFTDISVTATGGSIGPATQGIIYQSSDNKVLWHIDFGGSETAGVGTDFKVTFDASGFEDNDNV